MGLVQILTMMKIIIMMVMNMIMMVMMKMTLFDQQSQRWGSDVRERKRSPFIVGGSHVKVACGDDDGVLGEDGDDYCASERRW